MADPGSDETDKIIAEIEARIKEEYTQAEREIKMKLDEYLQLFYLKDQKWREWVATGKKTNAEYQQWRIGQLAMGERWERMRDVISEDLLNANSIAQSIAQDYCADVYALNHAYGTFEIEQGTGIDTAYTLYSRDAAAKILRDKPKMLPAPGKRVSKDIKLGKAKRWNNNHIQSVMMQAILQGDSIPMIARRLANVVGESDRKAATRNARTMATNAQNMGRLDSYKRAESMGIKVRKTWVATLDSRTRHEHRLMDGQTVDLDEPFKIGDEKIRWPGDPEAPGHLVYNCRCTTISSLPGFERDLTDLSRRNTDHMEEDSYEAWRNGKVRTKKQLAQEELANRMRAEYIREYRENPHAKVPPKWDDDLTIDALAKKKPKNRKP